MGKLSLLWGGRWVEPSWDKMVGKKYEDMAGHEVSGSSRVHITRLQPS